MVPEKRIDLSFAGRKFSQIVTPWAGMFCTLLARSSYIAMDPAFVPTAILRVAKQWEIWEGLYFI